MAKKNDVPRDDEDIEPQNDAAGQILRPMLPLAEQRKRDLKVVEALEADRAAEEARRELG